MEPFVHTGGSPSLLLLKKWMDAEAGLAAGFTGRSGGAGEAPYDSLNAALHVGDDPQTVLRNREILARSLGFEPEDWTCGEQVHGAAVAVVSAPDRGRGSRDRTSAFQDTDGLLTDVPGVLLTSFYADCVPLFFWDPERRAVGLAHAGWKGTVAGIAAVMVKRMQEEYGSRPGDLRAAIGPSIGACCYEVDEAVMDRARPVLAELEAQTETADPMFIPSADRPGRTMLNLKECNRRIMIKAGILPTRIECTSWCTSCRPDLFFSYRKENGTTGRMTSFIGLKES
ncbi:peptidoglycan editing factor PgeF [Paenibacillus glufosinatiresistens]|uniref:peptidoglycan editing factor PgeF n=1 Tax=Paenibacillus glufosinatiresistens TaxID=3070657 RepID=UPI00286E8AAE|nr:peptidoglycan editing factor PgeF [Paenibacillus sp. YX.27]